MARRRLFPLKKAPLRAVPFIASIIIRIAGNVKQNHAVANRAAKWYNG